MSWRTLGCFLLFAAGIGRAAAADYQHGAMMRVATIFLAPDDTSAKIAVVDRGREVVVMQTSRDWLHVEASLTNERVVSGWILGKGVISSATPNGDKILYGEAVDSEDQASSRNGRAGAAQDAMRLYYEVYELFPSSPLAGESLYRAADIRWQLEKADVMSRPSAHTRDPILREGMDEQYMKEVIKKFPGTKWADRAAFHLIDNKLCGDWQGTSKCPAKEADVYEKYAKEHPDSPNTAEALYDAAWRWSALVEIYKTEGDAKKSVDAKSRAISLAQNVASQYTQNDWGARAQRLLYMLQQDIPTYGDTRQ